MGFFEDAGCIKTMDVSIEDLKNPRGPSKRFKFNPGDIIVMSKSLMTNLIIIKWQHIMHLYTGRIHAGVVELEPKELIDNYKFAESATDLRSFICAFTRNGDDYAKNLAVNYDIFGGPKSIYSNMCRCMSPCEGKRFEFVD